MQIVQHCLLRNVRAVSMPAVVPLSAVGFVLLPMLLFDCMNSVYRWIKPISSWDLVTTTKLGRKAVLDVEMVL